MVSQYPIILGSTPEILRSTLEYHESLVFLEIKDLHFDARIHIEITRSILESRCLNWSLRIHTGAPGFTINFQDPSWNPITAMLRPTLETQDPYWNSRIHTEIPKSTQHFHELRYNLKIFTEISEFSQESQVSHWNPYIYAVIPNQY